MIKDYRVTKVYYLLALLMPLCSYDFALSMEQAKSQLDQLLAIRQMQEQSKIPPISNKNKIFEPQKPQVTFNDIVGEIPVELKRLAKWLSAPLKY